MKLFSSSIHSHMHTHTCTHAHLHTCTHTHLHTCTHTHLYTCTHAHLHTGDDGESWYVHYPTKLLWWWRPCQRKTRWGHHRVWHGSEFKVLRDLHKRHVLRDLQSTLLMLQSDWSSWMWEWTEDMSKRIKIRPLVAAFPLSFFSVLSPCFLFVLPPPSSLSSLSF